VRQHLRRRSIVTTGIDIDDPGAPKVGASARPARPALGARLRGRAAVAMFACVASLGTLGSYAWRHRIMASGLDAPPFRIADAAWRPVLSVAAKMERSCPPSVPVAILYVSGSCIHCRAELVRWSNLVRAGTPQLSCMGLAVVAVPDRSASPPSWLPTELASRLLWDHDGTIGRALGARLVPLAAYVTGTGVVIERVVGETSEATTLRHLADLRRVSGANGGDPRND
jgi:hypothetical protein